MYIHQTELSLIKYFELSNIFLSRYIHVSTIIGAYVQYIAVNLERTLTTKN